MKGLIILNKQELADYFGVAISTINTNFPLFCKNQLKRGFLITRTGIGAKAVYTVERAEKQDVNKSLFSTRGNDTTELDGEKWIETYCSKNYEVSNLGRVRNKRTKIILKGTIHQGYVRVSIDNQNYNLHRVVLQSWQPNINFEKQIVDHINGNRTDNRLENLRWGSPEDNTRWMLMNRKEITTETTRLINKYGYEKTLELLQGL